MTTRKINNIAHKGTHAHIYENTYFINFDLLQNLWIHDSRQLVFFCLLRRCLRRDLTCRDCVVHWFPWPSGRVRLITSVEQVYRKPPIKLRFYGHRQLICLSSSICNIWSVEVWLALFRRNPVTIVCRHVSNKRKNVDEGVTFASSVPSHMAQLHSTWIYVCCHRLCRYPAK